MEFRIPRRHRARTNGLDLIPTLMPRQATATHFATYKPTPIPASRFSTRYHWYEKGEELRGLDAIERNDHFACNTVFFSLFSFFSSSLSLSLFLPTSRGGRYPSRLHITTPLYFRSRLRFLEDKVARCARSRAKESGIDLVAVAPRKDPI